MENAINFNVMQLIQFTAILLTGLLAGLFYGYDCSVTKGLGNLPDDVYVQSFQSINSAIQNPYFFFSFVGNLIVLPLATWLSYKNADSTTFYMLLSATVIFMIAVFGVTVAYNIPLNEQLAKFPITTSSEREISAMRRTFEKPWNTYHTIRTVASIVVFGLVILSLIKQKVQHCENLYSNEVILNSKR